MQNERRSGNTTRLVDRLVQEFFTKGVCYIYEGRGEKNQGAMTQEALRRFKYRMFSEHTEVDFYINPVTEDGIECIKITKNNE